jgi:hypothetical protein
LSDAQAGAYLWVWSENLRLLLCEGFPSRVLSIDSEDVAQKPEIAAQRSMEHFGLPVRSSLIGRGITSAAVEGRHAKNASRKFNSVTRKRDLRELETRHHREVQTGPEITNNAETPRNACVMPAPNAWPNDSI